MGMLQAALRVRSLLIAVLVMMVGAGYVSTLLTLRLDDARAGSLTIAAATSAYFAGITFGSFRLPRIINRVGHIRAFAAFVSLLSATVLSYSLTVTPLFWVALRLVDGICIAAAFICLESWLNDRAERQSRGATLAAYMIALYLGQAAGQQLLNVSPQAPVLPFVAASIPISLAVIPVALTYLKSPSISEQVPFSVARLYAISPVAFIGTLASGIVLGGFYGFGAVYGRRLGMSVADTALLMSTVIGGGILLQWPLGYLSDLLERRRIIVATLAVCVAATLILAFIEPGPLLFVTAAIFGGVSFALYPLSVAHANDRLSATERVGATGNLVLLYSIGAAVGPLIAGAAIGAIGIAGLFLSLCMCAAAAFVFALGRQTARAPVATDQQQPFRSLPRTTPTAVVMEQRLRRL